MRALLNFLGKPETDALREQLASHRRQLGEALDSTRERIKTLEREQSKLKCAAITREDYARIVLQGIDRRADEQLQGLAEHFERCATGQTDQGRSRATVGAALAADREHGPTFMHRRPPLFGLPLNVGGREGDALERFAYAFHREAIKRAATEAIFSVPTWPDATALEVAAARLEEIERELSEARAEEAALAEQAKEFGTAP